MRFARRPIYLEHRTYVRRAAAVVADGRKGEGRAARLIGQPKDGVKIKEDVRVRNIVY